MERGYISNGELKDFIEDNNLMDRYSNVQFKALVSIKTVQREIKTVKMGVRISFDDNNSYGKVYLLDDSLDFNLFPTIFEAGFQKMKYKDKIYLDITDIHKQNPSIGKYEVKIIPLSK